MAAVPYNLVVGKFLRMLVDESEEGRDRFEIGAPGNDVSIPIVVDEPLGLQFGQVNVSEVEKDLHVFVCRHRFIVGGWSVVPGIPVEQLDQQPSLGPVGQRP